ncbi:MAG TPA: DUF4062 domain-containing protein [Allosphingosinicella sp.]|jgi:hypothetical protein
MLGKRKLQVFVSSTYSDLIEERQAAVSAILKAGHIPAGMELFASGDRSQMDVIKRWIDESDVYMVILGSRYGSVEATTGLSYTELEYDYAVNSGKPFFALVLTDSAMDEKVKKHGIAVTEQDHPDKLKAFRSKVMSRMCALCQDNKDIRGGVYDSILEILQTRDLPGWVRGDSVEDPRPLHDQIALLKSEIQRLSAELDSARVATPASAASTGSAREFATLEKVLRSKKLEAPAEVAGSDEDVSTSAYSLLMTNRNLLVRGWVMAVNPEGKSLWFRNNLMPILQVHRLITREDMGPKYHRYTMTELGLDLLAWFDHRAATPAKPADKSKPSK